MISHLDIDQFHTEVGSCFGPGDQPNEGMLVSNQFLVGGFFCHPSEKHMRKSI